MVVVLSLSLPIQKVMNDTQSSGGEEGTMTHEEMLEEAERREKENESETTCR